MMNIDNLSAPAVTLCTHALTRTHRHTRWDGVVYVFLSPEVPPVCEGVKVKSRKGVMGSSVVRK